MVLRRLAKAASATRAAAAMTSGVAGAPSAVSGTATVQGDDGGIDQGSGEKLPGPRESGRPARRASRASRCKRRSSLALTAAAMRSATSFAP